MTDTEGLQDIKQYFPNGVTTAMKKHSIVIMKVIFLHLLLAGLESPKRQKFPWQQNTLQTCCGMFASGYCSE